MAKKKKKHRRPVAPPVHSAPGAAAPHTPHTPLPSSPPPRPVGAEPPGPAATPTPVRRPAPQRKKTARALGKKKRRYTPWLITVLVIAAVAAAIVGSKLSASKSAVRFDTLATSAGCGKVQVVPGLTNKHVDGQRVKYSTSPPAGGDHYSVPLPAGIYDKPLTTSTSNPLTATSIYRAVHSLEHAAVIVWYKDLSSSQIDRLKNAYDGANKVIVAPYPKLKDGDKVALSAWGRLDYCTKMSTKVIDAFIKRYRGANSAPEPFNSI